MRHLILALAVAALAVASADIAPARAQDATALTVEKADLRWKEHRKSGAARDSFVLEASFPDRDALATFEPATDAVAVTVGELAVITTAAPADAASFRLRRNGGTLRRWTYRVRGDAGDVGKRSLAVNVRRGTLRVIVRRAHLRSGSPSDSDDVPLTVTVGDVTASTTVSFDRRSSAVWRYRRLPSGGTGPSGPVTWGLLTTGSLANAPRPNIEVARTDTELAVLWSSYGAAGSPPAVDWNADMVVSVSAQIRGPGQFPPVVQIGAVIGTATGIRVDWYLAGCDWNLCPGAPAPVTCATATPFRILRVTRAGSVQAVQGSTLGVCP